MFYDGFGNKGSCSARGGGHVAQGLNFKLLYGEQSVGPTQTNWRFCNKCYVMFYDGYADKGSCVTGGGHFAQGIVFSLPHSVPSSAIAQGDWQYCQKCHAMFYDGYADKGACSAGGGHVAQGLNFALPHHFAGIYAGCKDIGFRTEFKDPWRGFSRAVRAGFRFQRLYVTDRRSRCSTTSL
jgi:hypothetical protein